jgi:hypothetical protein
VSTQSALRLGVVAPGLAVAAALAWAATSEWPGGEVPVVEECRADGQPVWLPEDDLRVPVSVVVQASVQALEYRPRESPIVAIIECPQKGRRSTKQVTNSSGFLRYTLQVVRVIKGTPQAEVIQAFVRTSEFGPGEPEVRQPPVGLREFSLRLNDGRYWVAKD